MLSFDFHGGFLGTKTKKVLVLIDYKDVRIFAFENCCETHTHRLERFPDDNLPEDSPDVAALTFLTGVNSCVVALT
jgi:hypothetical protein